MLSILTGPGGFSYRILNQVLLFRLPRVLVGVVAGGVLAVVGGAFQGLLRNPLVDPWTLGVASGAALGAAFAIVTGTGSSVLLPVFAFSGAVLAIALVYVLARGRGGLTVIRLVLAGVIVSFFFSSLVMLVMVISHRSLGEAVYLMMGSLTVVFTRKSLALFVISAILALAGCGWLMVHNRELDVISLSEETALSLGVDVQRLTRMVFLVGSVAVGLIVAWTGAISFVGLVVPHLVRMLFGPKHSQVLPGSFLLGAGVLLFADVLVRTLTPTGLPLSVVTALVGVPFFIYLLRTRV
ncbi:MAG: iron ABC transporter permease [candidate division WOR-3 bacterium]|nr:iron ABC transporter permease [candidate division WOR-3 bacterium]